MVILNLEAFTDVGLVGSNLDERSGTGYWTLVGGNFI